MTRKPPNKPRYGHGWKESPRKPLNAEAKRRRAEWLQGWNSRIHGLLRAEVERL